MGKRKFKKGDIVIANDENFKDNVAKTAGRPVGIEDLPIYTYFEKDVKYVVKDTGMYTDGCHVLVEGSTQYVNERYFDISKNMTATEIIEQALNKAAEKGYKPTFNWTFEKGRIIDGTNYYSFIFERSFLKAIWGDSVEALVFTPSHDHLLQKCILWEWHAKQMLVADEPLKYLEKNINKDNWKKVLEV